MDPTKNYRYVLGRLHQFLPNGVTKSATYYMFASALIRKDIFGVLPNLDHKGLRRWSRRKAILQFSTLQELASKDGFRFMVVIVPRRERVSGENPYWWVHEANLRDVQVLDLSRDAIWDNEEEQLFRENDFHLSPAGNRVLAAKLLNFIEERSLLYSE